MKFPKRAVFPKIKLNHKFSWPQMNIYGDRQIAASFLDAVKANPDDAWVFVSKVHSAGLDLNELREVLTDGVQIVVSKAMYLSDPKNCLTRSVYLEDPERNWRRLLHLRMIKEPDHNGSWKICGVEQEDCVKI